MWIVKQENIVFSLWYEQNRRRNCNLILVSKDLYV
jgi:hypothetical protein